MKQLLLDLMIVQMSNFLKQMSTNFHFRFFICLSEKFSHLANLVGGLLLKTPWDKVNIMSKFNRDISIHLAYSVLNLRICLKRVSIGYDTCTFFSKVLRLVTQ